MIETSDFGRGTNGEAVRLFTLSSASGLTARITNYGGIVTGLDVPDRHGVRSDVVLGFSSIEPYLGNHPYFGAIIGRVAGRLTAGSFSVGGHQYSLPLNQGPHHLHGGSSGFDRKIWDAAVVQQMGCESLRLRYRSHDGEEGYPGNVEASVSYRVTDANALVIDYEAVSDRSTPLCLTNHAYFNLKGESAGNVLSHEIQILADHFTPVSPDLSHTGLRQSVQGEANDFRDPAELASRIDGLFKSHGDNFLLGPRQALPRLSARVLEPESGRVMEVLTTESCLQFYTGVGLDGSCVGKSGTAYSRFAGFCLECQGYPAALNFPGFESITLDPGSTYRQTTVYKFSTTEGRHLESPR